MPVIYAYADVSSGARYLQFGLTLHLQLYLMCASSEGAGKSAHMRKVVYTATDGISIEILHTRVGPRVTLPPCRGLWGTLHIVDDIKCNTCPLRECQE